MRRGETKMTDPRTPRTKEAQLPDPLDQNPADARPEEALQPRGSEDAQLFAEVEAGEDDVENADVPTDG
jgi:hypothetical protein